MAVGRSAASVVATVTGDHARRSQGSQQTAAESLCSAVPADSGRREPRQWDRPQEQVQTLFLLNQRLCLLSNVKELN